MRQLVRRRRQQRAGVQLAPHRRPCALRRDPLDEAGSGVRVERAITEVFGEAGGSDAARTAAQ